MQGQLWYSSKVSLPKTSFCCQLTEILTVMVFSN
uniref:Uncharacterized protein n=1 Tax=Arundo donax TaxID=35708 RepID=A0A0A8ZH80_ARUDO